jgi:hypothetical protein
MAIILTPFEIDLWNSDDQAIATLGDAHWDCERSLEPIIQSF